MDSSLVAFAIFCLIFMIVRSFWDPIPQGQKRVPGPRNYPLIGNILELGKDPHLSLTRLSQEYGEVLKIHIGTKPVLVLSGLETIRQALVRQGGDFLGRRKRCGTGYHRHIIFSPQSFFLPPVLPLSPLFSIWPPILLMF
uniref:unspecific monooxygenase n=1 Tax=Varanus komodoensis TaxID=61221 RepID=A0A8D2IUP9_VARKO